MEISSEEERESWKRGVKRTDMSEENVKERNKDRRQEWGGGGATEGRQLGQSSVNLG